MTDQARVLFVDDEPYFSRRYRDALRQKFYVVYCESCDEAVYQIRSGQSFDALVLDVMMPPPENVAEADVADGFETGLWLLRVAEDSLHGGAPPTVFLTNRSLDQVRKGLKTRGFDPNDRRFDLRSKADTSDRDLPGIVEDLIRRNAK